MVRIYACVCVHVCDDPPCPKKNTYGQRQPQNLRISNNSISSLFQHKKWPKFGLAFICKGILITGRNMLPLYLFICVCVYTWKHIKVKYKKHGATQPWGWIDMRFIHSELEFIQQYVFNKETPCSYKWVLNFQTKQKKTPPSFWLEFACHAVMNKGCLCAYRKKPYMSLEINTFN